MSQPEKHRQSIIHAVLASIKENRKFSLERIRPPTRLVPGIQQQLHIRPNLEVARNEFYSQVQGQFQIWWSSAVHGQGCWFTYRFADDI